MCYTGLNADCNIFVQPSAIHENLKELKHGLGNKY